MRRYPIFCLMVLTMLVSLPAWSQTLRVKGETVNLRQQATTTSAVVATLTKGTELEVIEKAGTWYQVRVKETGKTGFVNALLVDVVAGQPATPAPAPAAVPSSDAGRPAVSPERPSASPRPAAREAEAPQRTATTRAAGEARPFVPRVWVGLLTGSGSTAMGVGGGLGLTPFGRPNIEVQPDISYFRKNGVNLFEFSGNVLYRFTLPDQKFTPFAGAGLVYGKFSSGGTEITVYDVSVKTDGWGGSDAALQFLGGLDIPLGDRRAFHAELRFQMFSSTLVGLFAGVSF